MKNFVFAAALGASMAAALGCGSSVTEEGAGGASSTGSLATGSFMATSALQATGTTATEASASSTAAATTSSGSTSSASTTSSSSSSTTSSASSSTGSGGADGGVPCNSGPNDDNDKDGFTVAQGDCNDCDPNVNPGAIDMGNDEDCDPSTMGPPAPCDSGLALDDVDANDGAKVIELCQTATMADKKWGVLSASYTNAVGAVVMPGAQVGIQPGFGDNVHAQGGDNVLALSSGAARTPMQAGACGSDSCAHAAGTAPAGFPQILANCGTLSTINDDVALDVTVRTPTNATGYKFDTKFFTFEFPSWVCTQFSDEFIALVSPAPAGSMSGNVAFDPMQTAIGTNCSFMSACNAASVTDFAANCSSNGGTTCPTAPNPYCPLGSNDLAGTGFDVWNQNANDSGATGWLETTVPVKGGDQIEIRFAIWDGGDMNLNSTVLVDNWQWVTDGSTVTLGTTQIANPK